MTLDLFLLKFSKLGKYISPGSWQISLSGAHASPPPPPPKKKVNQVVLYYLVNCTAGVIVNRECSIIFASEQGVLQRQGSRVPYLPAKKSSISNMWIQFVIFILVITKNVTFYGFIILKLE
jgi:hypothetical protein